jgi:glycosyltransferase involved in cell wall biosynthesis
MLVSVVVPTFRRAALLDRCLAALAVREFEREDYEILVADDAAGPETKAQVEAWAARRDRTIRYLPVTARHGPAAARNLGWRQARGEIIAFTDDCIPDPAWLRHGTAAFGPEVAAVTGRVVVPIPQPPRDYEKDAAGLEVGEFVTANCLVRRSALEQAGGFDERFSAAWREDSDLHFTLLSRGRRIVRQPAARVVHPVQPAPWGVSLRQQRKSLFNALLFK